MNESCVFVKESDFLDRKNVSLSVFENLMIWVVMIYSIKRGRELKERERERKKERRKKEPNKVLKQPAKETR